MLVKQKTVFWSQIWSKNLQKKTKLLFKKNVLSNFLGSVVFRMQVAEGCVKGFPKAYHT